MDHALLLERWTSGPTPPAGLIYVRTYGAIFDADALFAELRYLAPDALLVDDRCACPPSFDANTLCNSVDAVLYSSGYGKYADIGYGGYAFISNGSHYRRADLPFDKNSLQLQTSRCNSAILHQTKFHYADNAWLDFSAPLTDWDEYQKKVEHQSGKASMVKKSINRIYTDTLPRCLQLPPYFQSWRFNIRVADKPGLLSAITNAGLFASGHYPNLNGLFGTGSGKHARRAHDSIINLFNDSYFNEEKALAISKVIVNFNPLAPSALNS